MKKRFETGKSITDWALSTFGPPSSVEVVARRAQIEMAELVCAARDYDRAETPAAIRAARKALASECADVGILVMRLCHMMGVDLSDAVDAKMAVNRRRRWKANGDGTARHV